MTVRRWAWGCFGLLALILLAGCGGKNSTPSTPEPGVDILSYDVSVRLDPVTMYIHAKTSLTVRHPDTLGVLELSLHSDFFLLAIDVNGETAEYERSGNRLQVALPRSDSSFVEIGYQGFAREGILRAEGAGQHVTFSQSWPEHGAGWMAGVHHPSDPAKFSLQLIVPKEYSVAASGQLRRDRLRPDSTWMTYLFDLPADAPTYTFAFAVAESFAVVQDVTASGVPIQHHVLAADISQGSRLNRTAAIIDTLEALLGPYPYAMYSTVEVPMRYAGMENASASFLSSDLYMESGGSRNTLEEVNIHEAVHQWFGNDVVPSDWAHLWLAEGFATYLTTVVYERLDGPVVGEEHLARMAQLGSRDARRRLVPEHYGDPEEILSPTVYQKGGCVLHLLRRTLGDGVFFDSLRRLAIDYADRPLSTNGLQTLLEEEAGINLDNFFAYWVYGTTIPTIRTTWDRSARRLSWRIDGDDGTLRDVSIELLVLQDNHVQTVNVLDGDVVLPSSDAPQIRPVGVLMDVRD